MIPVGYSLEPESRGDRVFVPLKHMCITGVTQEAGKTTTLEALIARSGARAITFKTKRGERAFSKGPFVPPYFRERADWVFVAGLLDATLREKNKSLRPWLMKLCRNTESLIQVYVNVQREKHYADSKAAERAYLQIEAYLELVLPQLAHLPPPTPLALGPGLNVMDVADYSPEVQALLIQSVLEHVAERERDTITVLPEAWQFIPETRGSPVKAAAEVLIRKGAAVGNYVWADSQDLAGVWKVMVRACAVLLVGVQREANEVKRTLANIPVGLSKPRASDVHTLRLGEFYVCHSGTCQRTYVQPIWMAHQTARQIACGGTIAQTEATDVTHDEAEELRQENVRLKEINRRLREELIAIETERTRADAPPTTPTPSPTPPPPPARTPRRRTSAAATATMTIDAHSLQGRLATLITLGVFDGGQRIDDAIRQLERHAWPVSFPSLEIKPHEVHAALNELARGGFLARQGQHYHRVSDAVIRVA